MSEYGPSWNYLATNIAEGTLASPTAVLSGHSFLRIVGVGYTGKSGNYSWAHSPEYRLISTTNWGSDYGGGHQWYTVKPGDTTQTLAMSLGTDASGVNLMVLNAKLTNVQGVAGGIDSLLSKNATTNLITKIPANYYAVASAAGVSSVTGTTNRLTASPTSGAVVLDISSTFEALLGKVANPLSQFAATTSAQLAGVISDKSGSGLSVFNNTPTFITPHLGTPADGVITNLTGTCTSCNIGGNAATVTTIPTLSGDVSNTGNAITVNKISGSTTTLPSSFVNSSLTSVGILTGLKVNSTAQSPDLTGTKGYTDFYQSGGYSHVTIGAYASGSFAGWIQSSDGAGSATQLSINPQGGAVTFGGTVNTNGNTITGKTESPGTNSTAMASTAYVDAATSGYFAPEGSDLPAQTVGTLLGFSSATVDASYNVGTSVLVNSTTGGTLTASVTYTDETNMPRTLTFFGLGLTSAALTTTGVSDFPVIGDIRVKASTTITVNWTTGGTNVINYTPHATIQRLR